MDALKSYLVRKDGDDQKCNGRRIGALVGLVLTIIAVCVVGYAVCTNVFRAPTDQTTSDGSPLLGERAPDVYLCAGETEHLKRAKRQQAALLIKRVARPLSAPPPVDHFNFSYNPPLFHDAGAKCAWGHLSGKRVPHLEDIGVSYDFQQLEARACEDPEDCKRICLRMHKTDDPYLCNYFTWHRGKKVALFYFLEPTLKWNLTKDDRVETFFWQCKESNCNWYWRPHRIVKQMSELTTQQLKRAPGLLSITQCTDFATCQFNCETRPSYKELQGQVIPDDVKPEDPTCDYIVMPSRDTRNQDSFMFAMKQSVLQNATYFGSRLYDSFEFICRDKVEAQEHVPATPQPPSPQPAIIRLPLGQSPSTQPAVAPVLPQTPIQQPAAPLSPQQPIQPAVVPQAPSTPLTQPAAQAAASAPVSPSAAASLPQAAAPQPQVIAPVTQLPQAAATTSSSLAPQPSSSTQPETSQPTTAQATTQLPQASPQQPAALQPAAPQQNATAPASANAASSLQLPQAAQPSNATDPKSIPQKQLAKRHAESTKSKPQKDDSEHPAVDAVLFDQCKLRGINVKCSTLKSNDAQGQRAKCIRLNTDMIKAVSGKATITLRTQKPVHLTVQPPNSNDFAQDVVLTPGRHHSVQIRPQNGQSAAEKRCGPFHLRNRRCATACNERLAVDACGCALTQDPDPTSAAALLALPVCNQEQIRSCVHSQVQSDAFFDCMRECKTECGEKNAIVVKNDVQPLGAENTILLELSFPTKSMEKKSRIAGLNAEPLLQYWMPTLLVGVVVVALFMLLCVRRYV